MIKADRQERLLRSENILRPGSIQTLVVSMLIKWPGASLRNVRRAQVFTSTMTVPQDRNVWGIRLVYVVHAPIGGGSKMRKG